MIWERLDGELTQISPCCSLCFPALRAGIQWTSDNHVFKECSTELRNLDTRHMQWGLRKKSQCRVKSGWIWSHIGAVAALISWLFRCLSASLNFPVFSKCFTVDTCCFFKGKSNQDKAKGFPMTGYWALSLCFNWTQPLDLHLRSSPPVISQAMHFERLLSHLTQNCRWLINVRQIAMWNTSYDLWSLGSSLRPLFVSLCNYLLIWKNHFQSLR